MDNLFKLPKRSNLRIKRTQPQTKIYVVDFKKQELVGETVVDNKSNMVTQQWGKSPLKKTRKKAA